MQLDASSKAPASPATASASTSPKHFWFNYSFPPSPGKRYWTAVGQTWIEQYESGECSRYNVAGRATVEGASGTLVVKTSGDPQLTGTGNEGDFQVFIPDIGSATMRLGFRGKINGTWQEWGFLDQMEGIE